MPTREQTPTRRAGSGTSKAIRAELTCRLVTSLILDYLSEQMEPETISVFEQHLRDCPDCVAFLNTYKKTIFATQSLRYEAIPVQMRRRVRQFLRERIKRSPRAR